MEAKKQPAGINRIRLVTRVTAPEKYMFEVLSKRFPSRSSSAVFDANSVGYNYNRNGDEFIIPPYIQGNGSLIPLTGLCKDRSHNKRNYVIYNRYRQYKYYAGDVQRQ